MSLRGRFVVTPALGKGEAVMHLRVQLNLAGNPRLFEQILEFLDHGQGGEIIVLSTGNIELSFGLTQRIRD